MGFNPFDDFIFRIGMSFSPSDNFNFYFSIGNRFQPIQIISTMFVLAHPRRNGATINNIYFSIGMVSRHPIIFQLFNLIIICYFLILG